MTLAFRLLMVAALCALYPTVVPAQEQVPTRIVSLDYCADQFVLKLADRDRILAVSPNATADFSFMAEAAAGVATIRPVAEDILLAEPDLVVRSYGGGPQAKAFLERLGVPVLEVGFPRSVEDVKAVVLEMSQGLGVPERGRAVVQTMEARLAALAAAQPDVTQIREALYMTPSGVTSGPGSLVHAILEAAGLANFQQQPGWRSLPLERLAYEQPDVIAAAFFEALTNHPNAWSPMRHPVARTQMSEQPTVALRGAWTACGGWFLVEAVAALAAGALAPGEGVAADQRGGEALGQ